MELTQTVKKGGCAAKVAATELQEILKRLTYPRTSPQVLVDGKHWDDAAVYKLTDELAIVQTLDFFTPIVDTPSKFGRIAAANALSDIYAMGATPKTALAILAFPTADFTHEVIAEILQAAIDCAHEAGCFIVGGHSIDDECLKFGLSVSGVCHPHHYWSNSGARPGDYLLLTKALGTGTLMAGLKSKVWGEDHVSEAIESMSQLNKVPEILTDEERGWVHACTDVTGFGLAGHALQMAKASGVSLEIQAEELPLLATVGESLLTHKNLTKAHRTNQEYTADGMGPIEDLFTQQVLHDPQTSGGLLLSVSKDHGPELLEKVSQDFPRSHLIGQVTERGETMIQVYGKSNR